MTRTMDAADQVILADDFDTVDAYHRIDELADRQMDGKSDPHSGPHGRPTRGGYRLLRGRAWCRTHCRLSLGGLDAVRSTNPAAGGVSGHTHQVSELTVSGTRLLNPGSAMGSTPPTSRR